MWQLREWNLKLFKWLLLAGHCCEHARNGCYKLTNSWWVSFTKPGNCEQLKRLLHVFYKILWISCFFKIYSTTVMNECAQQCWRDLSKPKHDMTFSYGGLLIPSSSRQYDSLIWPSVSMYKSTFFYPKQRLISNMPEVLYLLALTCLIKP